MRVTLALALAPAFRPPASRRPGRGADGCRLRYDRFLRGRWFASRDHRGSADEYDP